jgi:hypothetical protein
MTWKELKEFANSLDEKQLDKNVVLWREDEAVNDINAENLKEDYYIGDDDEECYSLADAGLTIEDAEEKGLRKVYDKGSPILWEKF